MRDPQLNTRVDEEVRDAVEEYADREQTNKSTAVRQFLLAGMSQAGEAPEGVDRPEVVTQTDSDRRPSLVEVLATNGALAVSLALILLAFPAAGLAFQLQSVVLVAAAAFAGLSLVLANTGALLTAVSLVARLSLSRDWLATTGDDSQEGTET